MELKKGRRKAPQPVVAPSKVSKEFFNEKTAIFGENLRIARKDRGFTAEVLAKFLGISTAYVGLIERGERCPSMETFLKICEFFGESYEDMLTAPRSLTVAEKKLQSKQDDAKRQILRKQKMISSMINTFDAEELDYIITVIKSFKNFSRGRLEALMNQDDDEQDDIE